jgi:CYTH domain-containing protein
MEELELTYLPKYLPDGVLASTAKEMLDIYIPSSAAHPTLRIRQCGTKFEITKKQPIVDGDASRQLETTIPLTNDEYSDLAQLAGKRVQKTRFYYQENGVNYEVDVFRNELAGLVLVDVEFDALEKKSTFIPPPWALADVTQEKFIAGGMICGKKYSDIADELKKFNYQRIEI